MSFTPFLDLLQPLKELPAPLSLRHPLPQRGEGQSEAEGRDNAREQAAEMLAEAEQTLAQAQRDAAETLDDARAQAEALREAAWQEGFHSGKEAGTDAVELALRREHDAQTRAWRAEIDTLVAAIGQAREELWDAQEAEMLAFVMDIARQVVKTEVTQNPQVVAEVLHNALRRVTDKDQVRIRVSLPDAPAVRAMRDDLLNLLDGAKNLEIVDDRRIGPGGCVVETNAGTIDARMETQLDEVERALVHAAER